jgi:hypothetical protein
MFKAGFSGEQPMLAALGGCKKGFLTLTGTLKSQTDRY